jgi:hypothetical protein
MDWLSVIMQLLTLVLSENVSPTDICAVVGQPIDKEDKLWRLDPNHIFVNGLREAVIHFEDPTSGRDLIATVELQLTKPWRTLEVALERELGKTGRTLPAMHPGGTGTLVYDIEREGRLASVILEERAVDRESGSIEVYEILVRRFYE